MCINADGLNRFYIEGSKHFNLEKALQFYDTPSDFSEFSKKMEKKGIKKAVLRRNVGSRMTIPLQTTLISMDMVFTQTIRAIFLGFGGVATADIRKLNVAIRDIISIPIQAALLPILGSISVISPKRAIWITAHICKKIEDKEMAKKYLRDKPTDPLLRDGNLADRIFGAVVGLASVPLFFIRSNYSFHINAVGGNTLEVLSCLALSVLGTFRQTNRAHRVCFKKQTQVRDRLFFAFHGSYMGSAQDTLTAMLK